MRIDVVTIFPEYLAPLDLSLIGKAQREGLVDLRAHDLREVTTDRHHTVDDTPYGGGAGMVMKPDVWGRALDRILAEAASADGEGKRPRLIVPGPGGVPFSQALAHELAGEDHLVFACGRYEGIDERVYEYARGAFDGRVDIVSLGDYVLNGGEVAVLTMTEAVVRLLPGVVGNAESLVEESHEDGLLEYPVYTKPATWRGMTVPDVLLSGDHGRIAQWRHEQRLMRTWLRRPDLLPASAVPEVVAGGLEAAISVAVPGDAGELFTLVKAVAPSKADSLVDGQGGAVTHVCRLGGRLVGMVRHQRVCDEAGVAVAREIEVLAVVPDLVRRGIGRALLQVATGGDGRRLPVRLPDQVEDGQRVSAFMRACGYRPGRRAGEWSRKK
ncbi:tRNA (guanosine(37)-N1)-methyltransferase TrmD [Dermatophilus congolensis]|uniref:tRNA (guanosine(37)-N1)-methyltransferase TrmD n=1 Tax=Dermatophilus congolensis TaxID=1863 RepID=UPI001AAFC391|nr:tRNA (guanosine(37)-N1)-methyltransferase TrmD [Dermatophilus congolensis]MBO3151247.1 tRNA (guanosine(37)-N1)-methyltransferase TrmD [Dermatophilus congolensis]MBO3161749.1 tRNA (guanosine(37)-N1)-methyltransferase TrmD [Dermatophilus congolensis]MBO3162533.1 tRNA (guanosine(37)-N1)-methyltransferase TrmD [Dermatophilus congolensis]MBO3176086.1 tRNA (guanosine(37)-N1)-methyltransferase TrmD [Dermatophilus congolensis]